MILSKRWIHGLIALLAVPSAVALWEHGYFGVWRAAFSNSATVQVLVDLSISLVLVTTWMVRDARRRGESAGMYLWITLFFGAFGPLLYLLRVSADRSRDA